jgi:hypothetical protein
VTRWPVPSWRWHRIAVRAKTAWRGDRHGRRHRR